MGHLGLHEKASALPLKTDMNLIVTTCATLVPTSRYPTLRKLAVLCLPERTGGDRIQSRTTTPAPHFRRTTKAPSPSIVYLSLSGRVGGVLLMRARHRQRSGMASTQIYARSRPPHHREGPLRRAPRQYGSRTPIPFPCGDYRSHGGISSAAPHYTIDRASRLYASANISLSLARCAPL